MAGLIRRHFVSAVKLAYPPLPGADTAQAGSWILSQETLDAHGTRIGSFEPAVICAPVKEGTSRRSTGA